MAVSLSFEAPQVKVNNGTTGIEISQVVLPYSIHNTEYPSQYLGGQMTLGQSDGIKLSDNTKDWERIGLAKIKNMVADAQLVVPEPEYMPDEDPVQSEATSEATVADTPASETDDSVPTIEE